MIATKPAPLIARRQPAVRDGIAMLVCCLAVAVPLWIAPLAGNAFELPKAMLVRTALLLVGALAAARFLAAPRLAMQWVRWRLRNPLALALFAYGAVYLAATAQSVDPHQSFWGSYTRQQGLLTLLGYAAIALATATELRARPAVDRLWQALVWGSIPVVAMGLLQAAGIDPWGWRSDAASPVLSTVGRANFLGAYLVLVIPLTVGRAALARRRSALAMLLACQVACLALTQARSAWLGLAAGALVFGAVAVGPTRRRRLAAAALGAGLLVLVLVALFTLPQGPLSAWAHASMPHRLAALFDAGNGSGAARLTIWRTTLPLIAARPWLGYGPENLQTTFAAVFPPELVYTQGRHVVVDRAHNLWLDLGLSGGMAAFLAFAALLAAFGRLAWRGLRRAPDAWTRAIWTALVAAVAGHLVDLQFSFEVATSATLFWLLLGMATALSQPAGPPQAGPAPPPANPSRAGALLVLCLGVAALLAGPLVVRPVLADSAYGRSLQAGQPLAIRLASAARAVQLSPGEPVYRLGLAARLTEAGDWPGATRQAQQALDRAPGDPGLWAALGDLEARWGQRQPEHLEIAAMAYRQAIARAPTVATYHTALGLILTQQGAPAAGAVELRRAVALDATDGLAFSYLGDACLAQGQVEEALAAYQQAIRWEPTLEQARAGIAYCSARLGLSIAH